MFKFRPSILSALAVIAVPVAIALPGNEANASASCYNTVHTSGSSGECVSHIQQRLDIYGCAPGPVDGVFGNATAQAVIRFQTANWLNANGIVGIQTIRLLDAGNSRYCPRSSSGQAASSSQTQPATAPSGNGISAPANSGQGRRVVYSMGRNQFWLVQSDGTVTDSGPTVDNDAELHPGTYYSGDRIPMNYSQNGLWALPNFVRITGGMGFHGIPIRAATPFGAPTGRLIQSESQLGLSGLVSGGCVRLGEADSQALWAFASYGTKIVVVI